MNTSEIKKYTNLVNKLTIAEMRKMDCGTLDAVYNFADAQGLTKVAEKVEAVFAEAAVESANEVDEMEAWKKANKLGKYA